MNIEKLIEGLYDSYEDAGGKTEKDREQANILESIYSRMEDRKVTITEDELLNVATVSNWAGYFAGFLTARELFCRGTAL